MNREGGSNSAEMVSPGPRKRRTRREVVVIAVWAIAAGLAPIAALVPMDALANPAYRVFPALQPGDPLTPHDGLWHFWHLLCPLTILLFIGVASTLYISFGMDTCGRGWSIVSGWIWSAVAAVVTLLIWVIRIWVNVVSQA